MITSRQVRAARALLGWTQEMLTDKALVALTALKHLERPKAVSRCAKIRVIAFVAHLERPELCFWPLSKVKV